MAEPDGEASYANALLTTLAKGRGSAVTLTPGRGVPELAPLASDSSEQAWIGSLPFRYGALDGTKVIAILLGLAGWRFYHVRRRHYHLTAVLALPGEQQVPVEFAITRTWVLSGPIVVSRVSGRVEAPG